MNLDNVTVEMRPRSEWEAVDFGARLVRRDAHAIYASWFAVTLPMLALAIAAIWFTPYGSLATILYWWFEPVTDAPILRIISRRLFGEDADVRSALRALPHLLKRNWIFLLPPYRFHLARSIAMPVTQLEGLRGAERRARAKVLGIKISNYGIGVTAAYQHLALALYICVYLLVFALVPTAYQDSVGLDWFELSWETESRLSAVVSLLAVYVAQSILHPWFVGAGFGLYINCRTQLEAWDIEVAFRRLVQRRSLAAVMLCAVLTFSLALAPPQVRADEPVGDPGFAGFWSDEEVDRALHNAMSHDDLQVHKDVERWQKIDSGEEKISDAEGPEIFDSFFRGFAEVLGFLIEFGLWIIVAGLIILIIAARERWLPYVGWSEREKRPRRRVVLSSGEVTAESMPDDLPAAVRELWQAGKLRDALSLLYRGSLFAAVVEYGVRLPHSATEGLCLTAMREQAASTQAEFFKRIVQAWIVCAYGFREPGDEEISPLLAEWQQHFGKTA